MTEETQDFSELEVPGEPGLFWCRRHRKVQTRLRCGRCEKPICPKCTRMGPTGARCVECASNRTQHIYKVGPLHMLLTFTSLVLFSIISLALLQRVGFFLLLFVPLIGAALSKAIPAITRGKRGPVLASVATAGAVVGALVPVLVNWLIVTAMYSSPNGAASAYEVYAMILPSLGYSLIFLVLIIPAIWYWIK